MEGEGEEEGKGEVECVCVCVHCFLLGASMKYLFGFNYNAQITVNAM